ncbi:hypothetical protein AgCh_008820 [Apium graveolens]
MKNERRRWRYVPREFSDIEESQLSGYLHWLERKVQEESKTEDMNEIDKLADMFIANCHEKFLLEKQESYRMFQEMMARIAIEIAVFYGIKFFASPHASEQIFNYNDEVSGELHLFDDSDDEFSGNF